MRILALLFVSLVVSGCVSNVNTTSQGQPFPPFQQPQPPAQTQQTQNPDDGQTGSLNHGYLQAQPYTKIIIEIDYVQGYEPAASTKNALRDFFENVAGKPVMFSGGNVITPIKSVYAISDLDSVEKSNRNHQTGGDTAVVYFMFVNGQFENGGALGVAYKASTAALFVERINDATTALILYPQIEEAVAVHELGHLLGLVNINYRSGRDHEDASHPNHSKNQNSVMFWAVEDISLKNVLNFGPPRNFDGDDLFDIEQIRSGSY